MLVIDINESHAAKTKYTPLKKNVPLSGLSLVSNKMVQFLCRHINISILYQHSY